MTASTLSRSLYGNPSTVGRGKNAQVVEKMNLDWSKKEAAAAKRKSRKYLKAMQLHTEIKRLRTPQDSDNSDNSEVDEIEEPDNLETGIVALAARTGLDLAGNTATIAEVERILKVFVKDSFKKVIMHTNERNGKVVTLEDVMRVVRKDTSIIGL